MRKLLICLIALLLYCFPVSGQGKGEGKAKGHSATHESDSTGVKDAVKRMEDELRQGNLKSDPSAMEKYLAEDFHTVSGATGRTYTKQQVIDRLKSGAAKFTQINVANEDVALFGNDLAIAHGEADVKSTSEGKDTSGKYHFARTWLKRNGKWQSIWFQTTKIP